MKLLLTKDELKKLMVETIDRYPIIVSGEGGLVFRLPKNPNVENISIEVKV